MHRCHRAAAEALLVGRNSAGALGEGRLDLHGLHVGEALDLLGRLFGEPGADTVAGEEEIGSAAVRLLRARAGRPGAPSHVTVVTGSGHHSLGQGRAHSKVSPLLEAVTQFCQARCGSRLGFVKDDQGHVGAVKIPVSMLK